MRRKAGLLGALAVAGCAFMFEGTSEFEATYELDDVDTLQLHLDSGITLAGDPMRTDMVVKGTWHSVGGSENAAIENAEAPTMPFEIASGVGRLTTNVPIEVQGLVELRDTEVDTPSGLDLEIETHGDVSVQNMMGLVEVDTREGDASVTGALGDVVITATGQVDVVAFGHVDVATGEHVIVEAQGQSRDVIVDTSHGDIEVYLPSDADIDLQITGGEIRVSTPNISTIANGSFDRLLGNGSVAIWLDGGGDVTVTTDAPP